MTISTTSIKNSYSGDNSTTVFNYTFKVSDEDEIQVIIRASTGTETVKTKTTHYTVSGVGNANGGSVTFTSGNVPTNTETVVLRRSTPQTQGLDLIENDPMPADNIETAYDKLTAIGQELQEQVDRSLKLSRTNTMTSTEFTVDATNRAGKILAFDSSGEIAVTQELGTYKGNWAASTAYVERDLVKDTSTNNIFLVNAAHTSSGSQPLTSNANSAKYDLIVDAATATTSATNAASSATAAASSATSASSSATTATTKASEASTSASNAASSATSAASSATTATSKASDASTSETNAGNSATAAASSATSASGSASTATTKASEAATSATNAATSASTATTKASEASTSATNAASSASTATTKASEASTSATNAASSATSAASSATSAANSLDTFDDTYLGAKSNDPSTDNDGDALATGMLYTNTTSGNLRYYNGSAWINISSGLTSVSGDASPTLAGDLDLGGNDITGTGGIPAGNLTGTVANARLTGSGAITINGTSIALGASGSIIAGLELQAVKTANFNAADHEIYPVNTSGGSDITATLPSNAAAGNRIAFVDYAGTFNTNHLNIDPNGKKIEGLTKPVEVSGQRRAVELVFIDNTQGWLVLNEGSSDPIVQPAITWDTASGTLGTITDAQRGGGFSVNSAGASTNIGTISFAVTSGALPSGLSISSSTGAITGTVTSPVSTNTASNFTVTATVATLNYQETRDFSITVNAPIITFSTASGSIGTVQDNQRSNGSYSLSAVTATVTSGSLTYAVTTGSLPASVALNSSTGAITGDFDAVGSDTVTTFTITATEGTSGVTAAREFSIQVNQPVNVSYLLVAGGAGGGNGGFHGAGGGGAGGLLTGTISNASGSYTISIGGGGGAAGGANRGGSGSNSSISSVATATGGGGGGGVSTGAGGNKHGGSGGSGGGGGHDGGAGSGGSGTSGQGNNGGNGVQGGGGGGGGGKGSAGSAASGGSGGAGGTGFQSSTVASATSSGDNGFYASGGSGGNNSTANDGGGAGHGGNAAGNTGGGGGAGGNGGAGNGGSGIAILYYTSGSQLGSGGTVTNSGGVYYHKFTSGGTFSI